MSTGRSRLRRWTICALCAVILLRMVWTELAYREKRAEVMEHVALETNVGDLDFDGTPLADALQQLSARAGVPIVFRKYAALAEGVAENAPVNLRLRRVSLQQALRAVLESTGGPLGDLGFRADGDVVIVSTKSHLGDGAGVLRVYDVRKLIGKMSVLRPELLRIAASQPTDDAAFILSEVDVQNENLLLQLITHEVAPDSWKNRTATFIDVGCGRLCVTQSPEVHQQMVVFLRKLDTQYGVLKP